MKKINLYDYQQEMLENITKALTNWKVAGYIL